MFQPGIFPEGPEPKIRVGERYYSSARCRVDIGRLVRAIRRRFARASTIGLHVDPGVEMCFALTAIIAAGKTCVPFDFVRHHDNLGDCIDENLPLIIPGQVPPFAGATYCSVAELLDDAGSDEPRIRPRLRASDDAPLFSTRLGLVRLEFGRNYLSAYFRRLDQWMPTLPATLLGGVAPYDFIGLLELFWYLHRPGRLVFAEEWPTTAADLLRLVRAEKIDCLQCDSDQAAALGQAGQQLDAIIMGRNEDVESDRFRRLMR